MRDNIVDNIEQCGQHNIVQACFLSTLNRLCVFFAVYVSLRYEVENELKACNTRELSPEQNVTRVC